MQLQVQVQVQAERQERPCRHVLRIIQGGGPGGTTAPTQDMDGHRKQTCHGHVPSTGISQLTTLGTNHILCTGAFPLIAFAVGQACQL